MCSYCNLSAFQISRTFAHVVDLEQVSCLHADLRSEMRTTKLFTSDGASVGCSEPRR